LHWLVALQPDDEALRIGLAYAVLEQGRTAETLQILAVYEGSLNPAVQYLRGKALGLSGDRESAQRAFRHYIQARRKAANTAAPTQQAAS
jgi:predicted Zn-dependent protease